MDKTKKQIIFEEFSNNNELLNMSSSELVKYFANKNIECKQNYLKDLKADFKKATISGVSKKTNDVVNVITCNNDVKTAIEKNNNNSNYDNVIKLLQDSLQNHSLQISELHNRITELESKKDVKQSEVISSNDLQSQISKNDLLDTEKARYTFYITTSNIEYLKAFCKENNNISITSVINFMINSFKNNNPVISETPKPKKLF